ncbi:MAG: hypothetical protein KJO17_02045 [Acidimicrobiia bacterium]|nr:hypothetical protein [Acidimicrobiia bacterium]
METRQANPIVRALRSGVTGWIGILVVGVPAVLLLLLSLVGAVDGALDRDCQVGLFSACGAGMRSLAYVAFIGIPLVGVYYAGLALYFASLVSAWTVRSLGRRVRSRKS